MAATTTVPATAILRGVVEIARRNGDVTMSAILLTGAPCWKPFLGEWIPRVCHARGMELAPARIAEAGTSIWRCAPKLIVDEDGLDEWVGL